MPSDVTKQQQTRNKKRREDETSEQFYEIKVKKNDTLSSGTSAPQPSIKYYNQRESKRMQCAAQKKGVRFVMLTPVVVILSSCVETRAPNEME